MSLDFSLCKLTPVMTTIVARIIEAAYRCLSEPHCGPIRMSVILRTAGVSSRAFYRHFGSKDDLFLALLRQGATTSPPGWTGSPPRRWAAPPISSPHGSGRSST